MNFDQISLPKYFERLSDEDKINYAKLKMAFAAPSCKNRRNKSTETFSEIITSLKAFVIRGDGADADRALVCGICWLDDAVAINTRQLRLLISKCKSSINGSFQLLGYGTVPSGSDSTTALIRYFPFMKDNFAELRQWTIRQKVTKSNPSPAQLVKLIQTQSQMNLNINTNMNLKANLANNMNNNGLINNMNQLTSIQNMAINLPPAISLSAPPAELFISPAPELLDAAYGSKSLDVTDNAQVSLTAAEPQNSLVQNNDHQLADFSEKVSIWDDQYSFTFPIDGPDMTKGDHCQSDLDEFDLFDSVFDNL
ncbi:hypothetical protein TRFO_18655 [Tritrichomonas foetus]|uniref:Initiator binding domain-containing protein n=1 Tax=Tritrichomonas foetus TaxID=1144522 RepID=A0A1J4KKL3_9EUKA|nr:hypothetical protein TRFO_18655 [Tritrichomonas foetus]|eukprot:OHT11771.1 hypothetical protein TRFO_18655 [Tritrichomonas foetus]